MVLRSRRAVRGFCLSTIASTLRRLKILDPEERHYFSAEDSKAGLDELYSKIDRLKGIAKAISRRPTSAARQNRRTHPRRYIYLCLCQAGHPATHPARRLTLAGFRNTPPSSCLTHKHNALFAIELDKYEAVCILDVRGKAICRGGCSLMFTDV